MTKILKTEKLIFYRLKKFDLQTGIYHSDPYSNWQEHAGIPLYKESDTDPLIILQKYVQKYKEKYDWKFETRTIVQENSVAITPILTKPGERYAFEVISDS